MPKAIVPLPTTKDLRILEPELRGIISLLPETNETATSHEVVVNFMRSIPPRPYENEEVIRKDIYVSMHDASPEQPPVALRLYIPKAAVVRCPLPVLMWSHHGGFFSMGPLRLDPFCSEIAIMAGTIVVAPAYRQTPENPFPAPFEDVYQVLRWLTDSTEAVQYGIDSSRIAIGGTSAGAPLSVGIFLRYRDEGRDLSKIRLIVLEDGSYTHESTSYSSLHNPVNKLWNANMTRFMWQLYLPQGIDALDERTRGYAVPALAKDLTGMPQTMVLSAQWDDLTNDAIAFAHKLLECGVPTEIHNYRGTFHVSDKLIHNAKSSIRKRQDIVDALKTAFFGDEGTIQTN